MHSLLRFSRVESHLKDSSQWNAVGALHLFCAGGELIHPKGHTFLWKRNAIDREDQGSRLEHRINGAGKPMERNA